MRVRKQVPLLLMALVLVLLHSGQAQGQTPTISGISPTSGPVGSAVAITGTNFGTTQSTSTVSLNGTSATVIGWSTTAITAVVPTSATSGTFSVTVGSHTVSSSSFTVIALPSGWTDSDVGSVGVAGSASFANGTFTVSGSGQWVYYSSDGFNFVYQPLSGDGTIIARIVSVGSSSPQAGVMIRETLTDDSAHAFVADYPHNIHFYDRPSTSASATDQYVSTYITPPYWVKLVRSGSTFTGYSSADGTNWTQVGTSESVTMTAGSVYVGLAVSSVNNSSLASVTFDNVSISSSTSTPPAITGLSATTGSIGSQVTISGTGFGSSESSSLVLLNGAPVGIDSWTDTSITFTISSGATTGPLLVSSGPTMNDSNSVMFAVTSDPLPTGWLDQDVGPVGITGSATYSSGTFTVQGSSAASTSGTSDNMHFLYQPLSGDGTILARIVSVSGGSSPQVGVMVRESLSADAADAYLVSGYYSEYLYFYQRTSTGANASYTTQSGLVTFPVWIKLVRSGSSFTAYTSVNGLYWTQLGSSQTVTMATNVYVGMVVTSNDSSSLTTATFDNVSVTSAVMPAPTITGLSASTGAVGSLVSIFGSGFGSSQGGSLATLNGLPTTVLDWTDTAILTTIPTGATTGSLVVSLAPSMDDSNAVTFEVTSEPLPSPWLDEDLGPVGSAGSATYSNGTFTVSTGPDPSGMTGTADAMHFVYQSLSGDGTIIARIASVSDYWVNAGIMIRETLDPGAADADALGLATGGYTYLFFYDRSTSGASVANEGQSSNTITYPYWVKLVRSGSSFSAYISWNGIYWTQIGSSQTITMATNVEIGLFANSASSSSGSATFDNVSINSAAISSPVITSISATTGSVGSQLKIFGTGFGSAQNSSIVTLNDSPVTLNSWSSTSLIVTIPTGAASGPLVVSVSPSMNNSNSVMFEVTTQPLPTPWIDEDIGPVSSAGGATYSSGTFTVNVGPNTPGSGVSVSIDPIHFVYQPLSGDGVIIARIASVSGSSVEPGIMMRETLDPGSIDIDIPGITSAGYSYFYLYNRSTLGASVANDGQTGSAITYPYWVKLVRSGSTFAAYVSPDGTTWTQISSGLTMTMATNVDVGLFVNSASNSSSGSATFDNVSLTLGSTPFVTGLSPVLTGIGGSVTVTGSNFGSSQGTSTVTFNGVTATSVSSWSDTQIVATVPTTASTGPVAVTVSSIQSSANPTLTVINPVITSLTPPSAQSSGIITIAGTGFGLGQPEVDFTGGLGTTLAWSDTSITVAVPAGATTGSLHIVEQGISSNSVTFTLLGSLSVTAISPASGAVGSSVTITGTGFGATQSDRVVAFYGVAASTTSWSDTSIVAVVPAGASTGPVSVTASNLTAYGPAFTVSSGITLTDSLGHTSTYASVIAGGKWYVSSATGSGCSSCTIRGNITSTFDSLGNTLSTTDALGYTTSNTYDSNNNVASVTQPTVSGGSPTTAYTYNSFGEVLTVTDPLGKVTTNTYDSHGNLTSVTSPAPGGGASTSETQFTYNSLGELTQITDPLGHVTTMTYTSAGLIYTITDPQSHVTTYAYDSRGNRTSITDASSHVTSFTYDSGNRVTAITYPDSTTTTLTYDSSRGRRTSVTDQTSKTTSYAYDDADRLTSVTDPASHATTYAYDTENDLTSIEDANSHTTSFSYDAYGRVSETTFPSSHYESYTYDSNNNLTSKTDRKSQTINYVYDALNRLTSKTYPDSTEVEYTYDLVGKVTQVTDPTGTYSSSYDDMGRMTGTSTAYSFLSGTFTNAYTYDAASNRTGFTAPDSSTNSYSYDTLNRLTTLANSWAGSFGFTYDSLSRRTQMTRPNSITTNYTYDNLSRLLTVLHQSGGSTIDGASYTLDSAGNRTVKVDQHASVTSDYTYDALYELTQVTQGGTTTESYSFDPVGNRTASLGVSSYTTNSSNELTATSSTSYAYDYNGNTTSKTDSTGTTSYTWDYENRLASVTLPSSGGTASFKYDPLGRRIQKAFTVSSITTTTNYLYDGDNDIEELNASGTILARYMQGQSIDEPLAESRSSTTSFYEADGLGSVTSLTNNSGTIANSYTYDSFGKLTASSGSLTNPFQYTGRDFDSETGLHYYRARYYDASVGGFFSEDPLEFGAGENFYLYAFNNAVNLNDPYGLCPPNCHCGCVKCHIVNMLVTGYDNSYQSTGKNPGDPGYGITTSGKKAGNGTIAAPKNYPMGTGMFVPGYGCGTVQDRGGAIKNSHIDVWFSSTQQALNWGLKRNVPVEVCDDAH